MKFHAMTSMAPQGSPVGDQCADLPQRTRQGERDQAEEQAPHRAVDDHLDWRGLGFSDRLS